MEIKERIEFLRKSLEEHNYFYYVLDQPKIDDYSFDLLMLELANLEALHPEFDSENSPTRRVGGQITKNFASYTHKYPMLSLANTYSKEEIYEFDQRLKKSISEEFTYVCELKYDGVAIGLQYENGVLQRALTRGDGVKGDEVTANIKTIKSIPLQLRGNDFPPSFEIRGEILMPEKAFKALNMAKKEAGEPPFANPRNAASGSVKLQDSKETAKRNLDCFLYYLLGDINVYTHMERLQKAKNWGFKVGDYAKECRNVEEVWQFIENWDKKRKSLDFDIDGIVIKVNQLNIWDSLGNTAKSPRWAIAYKFKAERVSSILESVDFQVGRTGAVTPVANLKPLALAGSLVKRASLHNADIIKKLDLQIGDTVYVEKGGEIIPKIVGVDYSKRALFHEPILFPAHCPECGTALVREEGEAGYYCPNEDECPPQITGKLEHFIGRKAMNIESLGEGKVQLLFEKGLLRNVADFYKLKDEMLLGLEKEYVDDKGKKRMISFQQKTVDNIQQAIAQSKQVPFERVLFALGIRFVGEATAKLLARQFKSIDVLSKTSSDSLREVDEVGERIAQSVIAFFKKEAHKKIVEDLRQAGLQLELKETALLSKEQRVLEGKSILVSGSFSIPRDELKSLIEKYGGKNISAVSKSCSFLLAGENMGPEKKKKAESLSIPILSEKEFREKFKLS